MILFGHSGFCGYILNVAQPGADLRRPWLWILTKRILTNTHGFPKKITRRPYENFEVRFSASSALCNRLWSDGKSRPGGFCQRTCAILVAVDCRLGRLPDDRPYVMFVIYMAAKNQNQDIVVGRDTIVMVHQGNEYKMPSFKELRENYKGEIRDIDFYRHLGKEGIISSWVRLYKFSPKSGFLPPNTQSAPLSVDEASMYSFVGFRTKIYFKNPGFKKGRQGDLQGLE